MEDPDNFVVVPRLMFLVVFPFGMIGVTWAIQFILRVINLISSPCKTVSSTTSVSSPVPTSLTPSTFDLSNCKTLPSTTSVSSEPTSLVPSTFDLSKYKGCFNLPKLTKYNYKTWRFNLFSLLRTEGITELNLAEAPIDSDVNQLAVLWMEEAISKTMNPGYLRAYQTIQHFDETIGVASLERQREIEHEIIDKTKLTKFDFKSLEQHFDKFNLLIRRLSDAGAELDEKRKVYLLSQTLPKNGMEWMFFTRQLALGNNLADAIVIIKNFCLDLKADIEDKVTKPPKQQLLKCQKCFACNSTEHFIRFCPKVNKDKKK